MWEAPSKELKDEFLLCSTSWIVREALQTLKQTGSVRDYARDFTSLMLDGIHRKGSSQDDATMERDGPI